MHEINVKLWRNQRDQNWSAEINGIRYESVSVDVIEGLIKHALFVAEPAILTRGQHLIH